jgi:glycosyltransferase involved in cell wall biosynthesis
MNQPTCSVVIRSKNEAAGIGAALRSVRSQTVTAEIVVVDSGSTDATLAIAGPLADEVVTIPPETFSFGRALNIGARRASGSVVFALSAHCVLPDRHWIAQALGHYADPATAGTCWYRPDPTAPVDPSAAPRPVSFADVAADPHVGFSNHASSWRRSVWEEEPFDEELTSCEDKEWMWRVMLAGWSIVADPRLHVDTGHRRAAGRRALWRREFAEHEAIASRLERPTPGPAELAREWWSSFPWPSDRPPWQRRLSPNRLVELLAGYRGDRAGAARRGPHTLLLPPAGLPWRAAGGPAGDATGSAPSDVTDLRVVDGGLGASVSDLPPRVSQQP